MQPVHRLKEIGQTVWLDFFDAELLRSGELDRLIRQDGVAGMTTNPTIFEKAIAGSGVYDAVIASSPEDVPDTNLLRRLLVGEVRLACDRFLPLWHASQGEEGLVSIEVSPLLAHDAVMTIREAKQLRAEVDRPNVLVKIPSTKEGIIAIEECTASGLSINVTLVFGIERYQEVAHAFMRGLESRVTRGESIDRITSVASFFVSRVDGKVDVLLGRAEHAAAARSPVSAALAKSLRGTIGIANAKLAFHAFQQLFGGERWASLLSNGARPQRLLWASTTPKDKEYDPLLYVHALAGPSTVTTLTPETLRELLSRGRVEAKLTENVERAYENIGELDQFGIDFDEVSRELEYEGVGSFSASYQKTLETIATKRRQMRAA